MQYLIPELNDLYSAINARKWFEETKNEYDEKETAFWDEVIRGLEPRAKWKRNCKQLVANDKEVYFTLLKRFKNSYEKLHKYNRNSFCKSQFERRCLFGDKMDRFWRMNFIKNIYSQIRKELT